MLALLKSMGEDCTPLGQLVSQSARKKGTVCKADVGGRWVKHEALTNGWIGWGGRCCSLLPTSLLSHSLLCAKDEKIRSRVALVCRSNLSRNRERKKERMQIARFFSKLLHEGLYIHVHSSTFFLQSHVWHVAM
jgi:hypothetical protein